MPIYLRLLHRKRTNLENNPVDVLLLGPQVRYMKSDFEKRLSPKGIPTDVISMSDYGLMNGEKCWNKPWIC